MTRDEFAAASIALLRSAVGWQTRIAERLPCNPRRVREWLERGETPAWVDERLRELMGGTNPAPWPRDEWIVGDAPTEHGARREYVIHTMAPRFVARVVECAEDGPPAPGEEPADVVSGIVYVADHETVLCEIDWIDEPEPGHVTGLLEAAADALVRDAEG